MSFLPTTILILGSSGYLGNILSHDLSQRGHTVAGIDLHPHPRMPRENFTFHRCDIRQGGLLEQVMQVIDPEVILDLAFVMQQQQRPPEEIHKINIGGRGNVLRALRGLDKLSHFILFSSTSVYGGYPNNPGEIGEQHTPRPNQYFYPQQKMQSEAMVWRGSRDQTYRTTILRIATIAGPRYPKVNGLLGLFARLPVIPSLGSSRRPLQVVHERDFVNLVEHVALDRRISGVYNLAPPDRTCLGRFAGAVGKRPLSVPIRLARFAARCMMHLSRPPVEAGFVEMASYPILADGSKLRMRYQYAFQRNSLQAMLDGYRQVVRQGTTGSVPLPHGSNEETPGAAGYTGGSDRVAAKPKGSR